jgi:tetratricopeptide (TPR) repeat protein
VGAYRAALEVRTRAQLPQDWAATQNNLGSVLSALGERAEGSEGLKYLNEAVVAYRAALEVRTRTQLPQKWAMTQNNLGNALRNLGERAERRGGLKYLNEAVGAYRAALEVRTRAQLPQDWAATQNNLGNALSALGERAEGSEGLKYLNDAVVAYRAALEVHTRAELPQQWAVTLNNLGIVLRELGARVEGSEGLKYLNEAVVAYRAALEVRTRTELPQDWAATQNNLGVVLSDLGVRAEAVRYLKEAVVAYLAALEVRTRAQLPQQWAATQNNLARTYLLLRDWSGAGDALANLLLVYPDYVEAYQGATGLYHEKLFKFDQAFALHQKWLARHKDDVRAQSDFTETHLTTARFSECAKLVAALLAQPEVSADTKTALRAIEIASLLALKQSRQAAAKLDALIEDVARQPPAFKVEWSFDGTRYFISQSEHLAASRKWLAQLLDALASKDRDTMLKALQEARTAFKE